MSRILGTIVRSLLALPLIAGLLAVAPAAHAQTAATTVNVPFAFSANNYDLPAGTYQVNVMSDQFLAFRNLTTGKVHCLMVRPDWSVDAPSQGRLLFHRYGSHNYLAKVSIAGRGGESDLNKSRAERRILASKGEAKDVASYQSPAYTPVSEVEVALNAPGR